MEKMQDDIRALLSQIDKEKVNSAMTAPTVVTDPLLTIEQAGDSADALSKLIKMWLVDSGMSVSKLKEMHRRYSKKLGIHSSDMGNKRNNLIAELRKPRISWKILVNQLFPVLGLTLQNVELTTIDDAGKVSKINLNDLTKKVAENFPNNYANLLDVRINTRDEAGGLHAIDSSNFGGKNDEET